MCPSRSPGKSKAKITPYDRVRFKSMTCFFFLEKEKANCKNSRQSFAILWRCWDWGVTSAFGYFGLQAAGISTAECALLQ
jgi:hypothetical protein